MDNKKAVLRTEILGLRNSIYTNNEIIRNQNTQLLTLDRKHKQLQVMLRNTNKDPNYDKISEIVDQRLNEKITIGICPLSGF